MSGVAGPNSAVSGKANRIGAYRKSTTFENRKGENMTSAERRRQRTFVDPGSGIGSKDFDGDDANSNPTGTTDVKMAIENLQETQ